MFYISFRTVEYLFMPFRILSCLLMLYMYFHVFMSFHVFLYLVFLCLFPFFHVFICLSWSSQVYLYLIMSFHVCSCFICLCLFIYSHHNYKSPKSTTIILEDAMKSVIVSDHSEFLLLARTKKAVNCHFFSDDKRG